MHSDGRWDLSAYEENKTNKKRRHAQGQVLPGEINPIGRLYRIRSVGSLAPAQFRYQHYLLRSEYGKTRNQEMNNSTSFIIYIRKS